MRTNFRVQLSLRITIIVLIGTCLLAILFRVIGKVEVQSSQGQLMEHFAIQMAQQLDYKMYIYFQEISALAELDLIKDPSVSLAHKRAFLDRFQKTKSDYAWIGLTSAQGIVQASTGAMLENMDVSEQPWFLAGKQAKTVQDVHEAQLLADIVSSPSPDDKEPLRFIDIAIPVRAANYSTSPLIGVLGAHLYWQWATQVRDGLMRPLEDYHRVEVVLLSQSGNVLLAPKLIDSSSIYHVAALPDDALANRTFFNKNATFDELISYQQAIRGQTGFLSDEQWSDQHEYLTGYAQTQGYEGYPGLGWVVLVRQDMDQVLAPIHQLESCVLLTGTIAGILAGAVAWWFVGTMTQPIVAIAHAADQRLRGDRSISMPMVYKWDEVSMLARVMATLFHRLDQRREELAVLNTEMENRLQTRTRRFYQVIRRLQQEVERYRLAQGELEKRNQELKRLSIVDELTQAANRRWFDQHLQQQWNRCYREQRSIALLMIDVDFFKAFNDAYGHPEGDRCLQQLAQGFMECISRPTDLVARYGGEEFAVILPDTSYEGALHCAQRIRSTVAALLISHQASPLCSVITVSIGVATITPTAKHQDAILITHADRCLYQAKMKGRDRYVGINLDQDFEPYQLS